ncbi:MAG: hypothetical protein PHQ84_04880 [Candidatus Omnitrophica bacterium]|jgi:hypothetical protein|nr:hypothetical protein [Candidatus Omnitrophota bacterium]MDD3275280.1 hypothetical protein [Candidatus Omnitrophota bacterium]MDD5078319.1 hypothetical protein [Candidatus Omnitrophota bacterium]MDD5725302.1 hypothetical protein [Candidatus Omnitrophota bacterium]
MKKVLFALLVLCCTGAMAFAEEAKPVDDTAAAASSDEVTASDSSVLSDEMTKSGDEQTLENTDPSAQEKAL